MAVLNPNTQHSLLAYFNEHVKPFPNQDKGFFRVTKKLKVFKKTCVPRGGRSITNLIIPVGATIYVKPGWQENCTRKMRANKAIVHSSARCSGIPLSAAPWSYEDRNFRYSAGSTVVPEQGRWKRTFSFEPNTCDAGIHFFLRLEDAQEYPL